MKTHSQLGWIALFLTALVLCGCHTTEGAGKDIEDAGEAIQDAAD
ncbi:MAG: entericidin A/B family lipoprotein [Phycisphaeraceae bacterium]|nr:entericidin A/B family lipoprotein [Phycisphaeraceae bacterium]